MNQANTAEGAAPSAETMSTARLEQLRDETAKLKVTGGMANPERLAGKWGIGLTILGFVIAFVAWWSAFNAGNFEGIFRSQIVGVIGVGISIVGIVIWIRNSLTRYLRFWVIRLVYEQREQTDRLIEALERERR
jgi:uncharacterized membrane protein YcjF (UPF0283 family)